MNLVELADQHYRTFGEQVSVIFEGREYTNLQMLRFANKLSNGLKKLGVGLGDRVMVMLMNCPEVLISYQGIMRAGGIIVPVIFLLGELEMNHILKNSGAKVLITSKDFLDKIAKSREGIETLKQVIIVEDEEFPGTIKFWDLINENPEEPLNLEIDEYDLAVILYTSGTTGAPKGVMLTHKNLYTNAVSSASVANTSNGEVRLHVLPLSHSYGLTVMNAGYMFNHKSILMHWFDPEKAFELIERYKVAGFSGVPAMFAMMLKSPAADKYDLSSLQRCGSGSAPLPLEVLRGFQERFGCTILEGYGLSETAPVVSSHRHGFPQKPGSIGIPIPGVEVRVVDDEENDLPIGEVGELIVKGPNVSPGYYKMPEETGETFRDGWLHTGDMARMDDDGYLYIVERKKDLIILGGFNVYPRDVEEVLYSHPAVKEAAVIGVSDPILGEEVKAFVVLNDGQEVSEQDLKKHCRGSLSLYKCPKYIEFIDKLPRNDVGKILRKELRKLHSR
jgi:long-chain acyl-CoA synthetase